MSESISDKRVYQIAMLVALACVLQISESMIPHPIPGLRLGLANMLTLTALVVLGFRAALQIAVMRTLLSSLMLGTFMSPTFILSFSAAVISTLVMGFFLWLSRLSRGMGFSIIGISILGALTHNMVQLCLAYLILVKHPGVFVFLPWLCLGSIPTGWVVGIVAIGVCRGIENGSVSNPKVSQMPAADGPSGAYVPSDSPVHRFPANLKIMMLLAMACLVLVSDNPYLYLMLFVFMALLALLSRTPPAVLFSRVRKFGALIGLTFLLPVFFNSGTHLLPNLLGLHITVEGIATGTVFSLRIILLILASSLLMRSTSPEEMTDGLASVISPLGYLGISVERAAAVLSLSWTALPYLWGSTRAAIKSGNFKKAKNLKNLLPMLSDLITELYLGTNARQAIWQKPARAEAEVNFLEPGTRPIGRG